ncbi:MAG TPA: response regulator transcription factor [Pyrinomonadaceae bacterium]|nr:response regulator transcription factor [Pyrinomonadaceae bacterium]
MSDKIKVLIVDDHPIFRRGLYAVISADESIEIVGEADSGDVALDEILRLEPDVAILDVNMPLLDGLGAAREIQKKNLPTTPIFLTMHADEAIFNAAVEADVKGFVIKDAAATDIVVCIKAVADGKTFYSSELVEFANNRRLGQRSPIDELTESERRILRLVGEGLSTKAIAEQLFISTRTVDHHRANIAGKLSLSGKNALFAFATANKLVI